MAQALRGDSLLLYDSIRGGFAVLDPMGSLQWLNQWPNLRGYPVGRLDTGSLVVQALAVPQRGRPGIEIDSVRFEFRSAGGAIARTLNLDPITWAWTTDQTWDSPIFAPEILAVAHGTHIHYAHGSRSEWTTYDDTGRPLLTVTWPSHPETVSPTDVAEARRRLAVSTRGETEIDGTPVPVGELPAMQVFPVIGRMLAGRDSSIWVEQYHRANAPQRTWLRFDDSGALLGMTRVPWQFRITDAGRDYLLGAWTTDAPRRTEVRLYSLAPASRTQR
jgi:hypothetical protein